MGVGEDFSTKIVIKTNLVDVLRRELAAPKWTGEPIGDGNGHRSCIHTARAATG